MLLSSCIDCYWMTGRYRMLGWRIEGKHTLHGANKVLWAEFNRESSRPIVTLVTVMAAEKISERHCLQPVSAIFHVCSLAVVHHVQMFELRPWSFMASIQWNWEYQMSSDVSPGEFGWRKLQLWPIQSTMAFGPESEASWQVSRDWIALPGCMWLSCGTCVNFFDMFQRSVGSIRGEMGKVFDESCKSWWPFNLHSESLDMLGLYWTYLWTVNHAGIAGTRTKEQIIHLSFIFLHASGDVGWCRMSMKLISWKWRIFSAADCGQSILDRRTMMWFFLDIQ